MPLARPAQPFGPWQTCCNRFRRWARDGTWARLLARFQTEADAAQDIDWLVSIDSTVVRAHQHAAGARPSPGASGEPADHAIERSPGRLTTKIHLAADGQCRPLALLVSAGHRHDSLYFEAVMNGIRVPRSGPGRPRCRPVQVSADCAYSSRTIRTYLRRRGIKATNRGQGAAEWRAEHGASTPAE
ncbi:IS5 family transposase [Streptomyces sp. NBC_00648]|uniref:IS5 family transposase n=1 Tax=Streptomyces sp. NBC_00648 TaxID=2975797 RepID=UPI00386A5939